MNNTKLPLTSVIHKKYWSWGFGNDSTYGIEQSIIKGEDFEVIASDPGQEMDYTYEKTIPFYKERWEKLGIKVTIIDRGYDILAYFWNRNQVPLGWVDPLCSSHFKRDLIHSYYREQLGKPNKSGKKYLAGRFVKIIEYIGHTVEEKDRIKFNYPQWLIREYPNYENGITKKRIQNYFIDNDLPIPQKSACWFCPNKGLNHFRQLSKDKFELLIDLEENAKKFDVTLRPEGSLKDLIQLQTSLDDFEEFNCSEYCYI